MVRIRMQRLGRTHRPFYRINAVDIRVQRNGKVIEQLGWYNPVEADADKQVELKVDRIKDWISRGAQPSETVMDILGHRELLEGELLAQWNTRREHEQKLGKCKAAVKQIEAAIAEIDKIGEGTDADPTPFSNTAKRELNNAKRSLGKTDAETAEGAAAKATEALESLKKADSDAKAKAAAEAPAEEATEGEGGEEAAAE
ncbi:MAG: 30S ribosomal protein S16 [Planctomycetota bacterium]